MLAIIPARGGSKGIPKKNIKPLGGKPLIAYTIEAAKAAKLVSRVMVSTDDDEIARVARECGADVPFLRPAELAGDDSLAIDNYLYTIKRLNEELQEAIENLCVLQPTSPLRTAEDIDAAITLFLEKDADSVIPCTALDFPQDWLFRIDEKGVIEREEQVETKKLMNRQDAHQSYVPNGAVFVFKYALLKDKYSYYSDKSYAYVMPAERSVDIDGPVNFAFAEFLMSKKAAHA